MNSQAFRQYYGSGETWYLAQAVDTEIERLTRELRTTAILRDSWKAAAKDLAAQRDRLRAAIPTTDDFPQSITVIGEIAAERCRQIEVERWSPEHDDEHDTGQLARAAACYAYEAGRTDYQRDCDVGSPPPMWPFENSWWKPRDHRRDLVRSAALIVAEIERLDRAALIEKGSK